MDLMTITRYSTDLFFITDAEILAFNKFRYKNKPLFRLWNFYLNIIRLSVINEPLFLIKYVGFKNLPEY
jgi:hypothetical protein